MTELTMTVAVCIPTCDRPELLKEAIKSCFEQTRKPDLIVIGDDSAQVTTEELVAALKKEIDIPLDYVRNRPRLGQNANINSLYDRATTTHIVLLHDDDLLMPNAIDDLANCWRHYPNLTAAYGKQYVISHEGVVDNEGSGGLNRDYFRTSDRVGLQPNPWLIGLIQQFPNDGFMITSGAAQTTRWKPFENVGGGGEFDFGLRLGLSHREFYFLDKYTAMYRKTRSGSISGSKKDNAALNSFLILSSIELPKEAEEFRAWKLRTLAPRALIQAIRTDRKREALKIYCSSYHRWRDRISLGGIRRLLLLLFPL